MSRKKCITNHTKVPHILKGGAIRYPLSLAYCAIPCQVGVNRTKITMVRLQKDFAQRTTQVIKKEHAVD